MKRFHIISIAILAVFTMGTYLPGQSGKPGRDDLVIFVEFGPDQTTGLWTIGRAYTLANVRFSFGASLAGNLYHCNYSAPKNATAVTAAMDCASLGSLASDWNDPELASDRMWYVVDIDTAEDASTPSTLTIKGTYEQVSASGGAGEGTLVEMDALPSPSPGDLFLVNDSGGGHDCLTDGGSTDLLCMYTDSSAWEPAGIAGGGGDLNAADIDTFVELDAIVADESLLKDPVVAGQYGAGSIDSDDYADGSIDLIHMSSVSVDSDNIVEGTIVAGDVDMTSNFSPTGLWDFDDGTLALPQLADCSGLANLGEICVETGEA